jgi:hypothetical protein
MGGLGIKREWEGGEGGGGQEENNVTLKHRQSNPFLFVIDLSLQEHYNSFNVVKSHPT